MLEHADLQIIGDGGIVPISSIVIENSFEYYCTRVFVVAQNPLIGTFKLSASGKTVNIDSVSFSMQGEYYQTILFPSDFIEAHKTILAPVKGVFTFEEICETHGIAYLLQKETSAEYWEIPEMRLCNFMDYVKDKISVMNGGGVLLTYSFGGLIICDLKTQMERAPQATIRGTLAEQTYDTSWYQTVPGNLSLTQNLVEETLESEIVVNEFFAKAHRTELVTNPLLAGISERVGRNQFYRAYYKNLRYSIMSSEPTISVIGSTVAIAGQEDTTKGVLIKTSFGTGQCLYTVTTN